MNSTQTCSLAVIGDGSVGKSSIIAAFKSDGFMSVYKQTIGCDFFEKNLELRKETFVSLRVWDIGGQSINSNNLSKYLGSSDVVFVVYDVTNPDSFNNIDDWLGAVKKHSKSKLVFLIGNKIDLINLRQVTERQHDKCIRDNDLAGGFFISAKTGDNLVKAFYKVAAEGVGEHLSPSELAYHDKVVKAHVVLSADNDKDEGRTAFADEIERLDAEAERKKNSGGLGCGSGGCTVM